MNSTWIWIAWALIAVAGVTIAVLMIRAFLRKGWEAFREPQDSGSRFP